jgi:hypothetical protein
MNRKLTYLFSLLGFFLMWGVFGFVAAAPRGEPSFQATVPPVVSTPVRPQATDSAGIPVTGETAPVLTEIVVFYGLIGLTALFLVLALLNVANKSTAPYLGHDNPPSKKTNKD